MDLVAGEFRLLKLFSDGVFAAKAPISIALKGRFLQLVFAGYWVSIRLAFIRATRFVLFGKHALLPRGIKSTLPQVRCWQGDILLGGLFIF